MAVVAAGMFLPALTAGYGAAATALIGIGVYGAAGYVDAKYIMPGMMGRGRNNAVTPRLLGLPASANEAAAPRVWAVGRRVRVPVRVLWQDEKVREEVQRARQKGGTDVTLRRVYVSALLALNDRTTASLHQLIGNGRLILRKSFNLVAVSSAEFDVTESGGLVTLAMRSAYDPDLSEKFTVGDPVRVRGAILSVAGALDGLWRVTAVTGHQSTPSAMTIAPFNGQSVPSGLTGNGGSISSPAQIEREDGSWVVYGWTQGANSGIFFTPANGAIGTAAGAAVWLTQSIAGTYQRRPVELWRKGSYVRVTGHGGNGPQVNGGQPWTAKVFSDSIQNGSRVTVCSPDDRPGNTYAVTTTGSFTLGSSTNPLVVELDPFDQASPIFPLDYRAEDYYERGTETQDASDLVEADKGVGQVPAYRGTALQGLREMQVTQFGDSLPFSMEAVIDPDPAMTLGTAVREVLLRAGYQVEQIDTTQVTEAPFDGYYLRGAAPGSTHLFPILLAYQVTTQERDGTLVLQDADRADLVSLNGSSGRSNFGASVGAPPEEGVAVEHVAREDLPTAITIRHQDPDNLYADGAQHFGIRGTASGDAENVQEIDLSNLVLTRKSARSLASTLMRKAHTNAKRFTFTLTAGFLDLLENDLISWQDGSEVVLARIIQRDVGANMLVRVVAVQEVLGLQVYGTQVQPQSENRIARMPVFGALDGRVLDIPPLRDIDAMTPGLLLAVGVSGVWGGCGIFTSSDAGSSWQPAGSCSDPSMAGQLLEEMATGTPAETHGTTSLTWDTSTSFRVRMTSYGPDGSLYSVSEEDVISGRWNWFALVEPGGAIVEVFAARTVTAEAEEDEYTLSDLLRGLRGTWPACSSVHPIGSRIVGLRSVFRSGIMQSFAGLSNPTAVETRFLLPGEGIESVAGLSVWSTWRNVRPFPPRVLTKTIGAAPNYDARFTTAHWTRRNLPLGDTGPYPLDETHEAYRFTIYDPTGATAKRIKTITARGSGSANLRDKFVDYPYAEQVADGYTPGASTQFVVDVQQIGDYGLSDSAKRTI